MMTIRWGKHITHSNWCLLLSLSFRFDAFEFNKFLLQLVDLQLHVIVGGPGKQLHPLNQGLLQRVMDGNLF